jgi:hypothetical protein
VASVCEALPTRIREALAMSPSPCFLMRKGQHLFQSLKNSKRNTLHFMVWLTRLSQGALITDAMLSHEMQMLLEPTCSFGIKFVISCVTLTHIRLLSNDHVFHTLVCIEICAHCRRITGHATHTSHLCVNPGHYAIADPAQMHRVLRRGMSTLVREERTLPLLEALRLPSADDMLDGVLKHGASLLVAVPRSPSRLPCSSALLFTP